MSIVERLRQHALPDPHDEREVMHAPLLKEAADLIEQQAERIKELLAERDGWREDANISRNSIAMLKDRCNHFEDTLATLRQRIADAKVVQKSKRQLLSRVEELSLIVKEDLL